MSWLLAPSPLVARAVMSVYYRIRYEGEPVLRTRPVILVANHQNGLVDPMLVVAAARRPVRFLAKSPLFHDRKTSWLLHGAGAIPVYRSADDPTHMSGNVQAFAAASGELARGAAVGIFPEGLSHSAPSLTPLKTGVARIALAAAELTPAPIRIVPIGLVFRQKDVFRSEVLAVTGPPIVWDDLSGRGVSDVQAVRDLTARILRGLTGVTLNLEQWADRPLVECAVRIWEAEQPTPPDRRRRMRRLQVTTRLLAMVRAAQESEGVSLSSDIERFQRRLDRWGLRPADVSADVSARRALVWSVRRVRLIAPFALLVAVVGFVLFLPPYWSTGWLLGRIRLEEDQVSTWKLMIGVVLYVAWIVALSGAALTGGPGAAVAVLIGLPVVGVLGLLVRERYRGMWYDARRFFLLRSRASLTAQLREERRTLGVRLEALLARLDTSDRR